MQVLVPFSGAAEHCRGNLQAKPTSDFGTGAEQEEEEGGRGSLAKFWSESNLHPSAFECLCLHLCCERCMQCTRGRKGWVEGAVIGCRRATYRQTTNCSCSSSRPGFPFSSVWPGLPAGGGLVGGKHGLPPLCPLFLETNPWGWHLHHPWRHQRTFRTLPHRARDKQLLCSISDRASIFDSCPAAP